MIGPLRALDSWTGLAEFIDKLQEVITAFRRVDADRRELVERLKPFRDAYHALPEDVREKDMNRRAELECGRLAALPHASRVVALIGNVSITVDHLFQAALVYEKHVEKTET